MASAATVAVVGAGSLLGREILDLLEGETAAVAELRLLSRRVPAAPIEWRNARQDVRPLDEAALEEPGVHLVLFCTGETRSRQWVPVAARHGRPVVDLSSAFRLDPAVPLAGGDQRPASPNPLRGGLRPSATTGGATIVGVPGALPAAAAQLLGPLRDAVSVREVAATLLVPASAAGGRGLRELSRQASALLGSSTRVPVRRFPHRLAFNLIPEVGGFVDGEDRAEASFAAELRRLLGLPVLPVLATAVRVPVFFGAGLSLAVGLGRPLDAAQVRDLVRPLPGVKLLDDPGGHVYPMSSLAAGDDAALVGRIRTDGAGRLQLFASLDPLRYVAARAVRTALALLA